MFECIDHIPAWVKIAGGGAVAGNIIVFLFQEIWKKLFGPKVRIRLEIDGKRDCLPESNRDWSNGEGAIPRKFARLRLYNASREMAKGCQVRPLHISRLEGRKEQPVGYNNPKPLWWNGGGNSPGGRLNLDSGLFNDDLMQHVGPRADKIWRRASIETRAMAILPHEEIESRGYSHEEAVEMAPDTELPITHAARELLRIIRQEQRRKLRGR
jgi:hypothetical protein